MACLDEGQIVDFIEGRLSPEEDSAAKEHIGSCDVCRELVAETARSIRGEEQAGPLSRGNTIGRYVILDVVGAGGMGVVYAAYDPELDRKVAVKLLRRDVSAAPTASLGELGKRLLREAKSMAKLSHPNVVSVYDAGQTQDGQVFVAMEFIQGASLGKWIKAQPRTWREVLDVYTAAGHGLAAAHAAGLIHRDFKPDNVMVGNDGRVLVTDFGLARLASRGKDSAGVSLAPRGSADEGLTEAGAIAGTPAYMSPEQLNSEPANVLTDQFSFCVSLYEGLYGERPYDAETMGELLRKTRRGRFREAPKDTQVPARVRAAILRGLSADPRARFGSMDELLVAVQPRRYQMKRRFIIALALLGIALAAVVGYRGARRERLMCTGADEKLAGVWDTPKKAQIHAAFDKSARPYAPDAWRGAEKTLDAYARGWVAMRTEACEATRIRGEQSEEMLDRRVECLDSHLRQLGALTRLFSEADGEVVSRAVEASLALPSLSDCSNVVALKAGVRPPTDPAKADRVQNARIHLARVKVLDDAGKYDEARLLVEPVVADARDLAYLPLEAEALALDGHVSGRLEDLRRAERALREAAEAALASGHDAIAARAFIDLVYFVGNKEARYDDARQWSRYAELAILRLGGNDELEADRLESFSIISWRQGKHEESLSALDRALGLYKKVLGPDHVKVAHTLDGIATVYFDLGRLEDAVDLDKQALDIAERALGATHPQLSMYLNNMGNELTALGRYPDALVVLRRALDLAEKTAGPDHADTVPPLDSMGNALTLMGKPDEAAVLLARAKTNLEKAERTETPDYGAVLDDMSTADLLRGRPDLALAHATAALAVVDKVLGKEHPDYGAALFRLSEALAALGKSKEALALCEQALAIVDKALGPDSPASAQILLGIGRAQLRLGAAPLAVDPLERAVKIREAHRADPRDLADARFALAQAVWSIGKDKDRARALAKAARATFEQPVWFKDRFAAVDAWLADKDGRVTRAPD